MREKRLGDAWDDYTWETDPELAHLDAASVTSVTYGQYLRDYANELRMFLPTSIRFAIETLDGKHIGNCSFYNINESRGEAELGILIGNRDYWNHGYGADVIKAMLRFIFSDKKYKRVHLKSLENNFRAHECFKKCGFTPCGQMTQDGYHFILMEVFRDETCLDGTRPPTES